MCKPCAHKASKSTKQRVENEADTARLSLRLWITGVLLALIFGGIIAAHFVLPIATCAVLWDKLCWLTWALLIFLVGSPPLLAVKKLLTSAGFRTILQALAKISREDASAGA